MADKTEIYKRIKITGMLSLIPLILACSLFGGYFLGSYLQAKFELPFQTVFICIMMGLLAAVIEIVKIIKTAIRLGK